MALQKTEALSIGSGSLIDNSSAIVIFSSANNVDTWSDSIIYTANQTVEYASAIWKCLTSNVNSAPSISSPFWQIVYKNCKDGDVCISFDGANSNVLQRANGEWVKYKNVATSPIQLNDGQPTPETIFTFIGSDHHFSQFEYSIKRGNGHNRKRIGRMDILNDGSGEISYSHEFTEIGDDVNAWVTPVISSGTVELKYTSTSEGNPLFIEYILKGWGQ